MNKTKDDYSEAKKHCVNCVLYGDIASYIKELEERNKEILNTLIKTVKDYKKTGWGYNEKSMGKWIKVIEKNKGNTAKN